MNYTKLTDDLFDRPHYSRNELNLFAAHHVSALQSLANPPLTAQQINATNDCFSVFQAAMGQLATKGAQQLSGTITREDAKEAVLAFISRKEGLIKALFGKKSATYAEFYPHGIVEYTTATVEGMIALLERFSTAANKYKLQLGEELVNECFGLREQYTTVRQGQSAGIALNKDAQAQAREARKALTQQLTRNVLNIAATCIENPDEFGKWFNFGLLEADNLPQRTPQAPVQG